MKKILLYAATLTVLFAACKKDDDNVATKYILNPSFPTIDFGTGGQFFSINTGGSLPTVSATAYDSTLKESYPVSIVGTEALNNMVPGLYIVSAKATNKYGYYTKQNVYVAVTNVSPNVNLAGNYKRIGTTAVAHVEKLANGLYSSDNLFGSTTLFVTFYFAHINDTTISIPDQETELGTLVTSSASLHLAAGDTSYSYKILPNLTTNDALRTFEKQ